MNQTVEAPSIVQMDELVEDVCWRLAATAPVARLAFSSEGVMQILPIIALLDRTLIFRTAAGLMLDGLTDGEAVVVEFDQIDALAHTGWSVIVRGVIERLSRDLLPIVGNSVHPWADGDKDVWLAIRPAAITGRAISRHTPTTGFRLPYMALD